jgi:hypothetical protein
MRRRTYLPSIDRPGDSRTPSARRSGDVAGGREIEAVPARELLGRAPREQPWRTPLPSQLLATTDAMNPLEGRRFFSLM